MRIALDNYEAGRGLAGVVPIPPVMIAIGPERGWSAGERDLLRGLGFEMRHLGSRVLRTETACVAAVAIVKAGLGLM
jgi:RsmE family RNA methyltransferase